MDVWQGSQPAITCSKLTTVTLEQGAKYVKVNNKDTRTTPSVGVSLNLIAGLKACNLFKKRF